MAIWDEGLSGNLVVATGLVVATVLLKRVAPGMTPGLRSVAVSGLKLIAETEFEMQDGLITEIVESTVDALIEAIQSDGSERDPDNSARLLVDGFERAARTHSERRGWHERDKSARYRHHVRKLKEAVAQNSRRLSPEQHARLVRFSDEIAEAW
jgi:hypothetical protein